MHAALKEIEDNAKILKNMMHLLRQMRIKLSTECTAFIQDCLRMDPAHRPTAEQLLSSDFVRLADKEAWAKALSSNTN
ncbi:hypothetical protein AAVH_09671 [Aphelenchoides avenae]|nr:hypothetical protein AAVH_09671 [Aphelenchus avenae]